MSEQANVGEAKVVRCKFRCHSKREYLANHYAGKEAGYIVEKLYDYEFNAVTGDANNEENAQFWKYTPSGSLKVSSVRPDTFEPGQDYYIDIHPA